MNCFNGAGFIRPISDKKGGSNIKSKQWGSLTLTSASQTVTISAIDLTKAIVKINILPPMGTWQLRYQLVGAVLTNPTTLTLSLNYYSPTVPVVVYWEVIEFNNVKSLQTGVLTATTDTTNVTISSINVNKSILFYSYTTNTTSADDSCYTLNNMYISSSTQLTNSQHTQSSETKTIYWQVIEFN